MYKIKFYEKEGSSPLELNINLEDCKDITEAIEYIVERKYFGTFLNKNKILAVNMSKILYIEVEEI